MYKNRLRRELLILDLYISMESGQRVSVLVLNHAILWFQISLGFGYRIAWLRSRFIYRVNLGFGVIIINKMEGFNQMDEDKDNNISAN